MIKTVGIVTVGRSDFSILRPLMERVREDPDLELAVIAAGMHLSPEHGMTVNEIEASGIPVAERVEMLMSSDTPEGTAKSMGMGLVGFGQLFGRWRPDVLVVMGDRFEMFAATAAALPFCIPVAHIHGGELSEGAIDDAMRHAITKMSHIHFTSTAAYRDRVIQLGEQPDRVFVSGAPALDNLRRLTLPGRSDLEKRFELDLSIPPLLVTFHPTTLELDGAARDTEALFGGLSDSGMPVIFTAPNADPAGRLIRALIEKAVAAHDNWRFVMNLGSEGYYGLMRCAAAMVGNSSSGIIEAASFGLPVVNVGNRQKGRLTGRNVLHVAAERDAIATAISGATTQEFSEGLGSMENPYGSGQATEVMLSVLKRRNESSSLVLKSFYNWKTI